MEFGTIERELFVEAAPEIVYEVISSPKHITAWWPDEADFVAEVGESGTISFRGPGDRDVAVVPLTVVATDPPRSFAFRWTHDAGVEAASGNSLLVSFVLEPQGSGTLVKLTETGFRELGWEAAVLEEAYADHVSGWDKFVPRLGVYVARLVAS